jgi:two-component system cell cycle sensor histidine kinase/response regulator CckA
MDPVNRPPTESEWRRANRALRVLRAANRAVVQARSEQELLSEICDVVVGTGGYRLAWIGFAQHDAERTIRPVASSGAGVSYLQAITVTWADEPRGRGAVGTSIRTGQISMASVKDPRFAPWREHAERHGYAYCLSLPLFCEGRVLGALAIYAPEPDAFDGEEVALLSDLATDLSFGIETLRKRLELLRKDARLERAHRMAGMGTWESGPGMANLDWSGEVFRIFGRQPGELPVSRQSFLDCVCPEDRDLVSRALDQTLSTGDPSEVEYRILRPDGSQRVIRMHAEAVRDETGAVATLTGTVQDITDFRRLEELLLQSQKLEGVGRLAGGVAHDFNNLLTVINGYSDLLLGQIEELDPLHGPLVEIRKAGQRAADLTQQLLAFSRRQVLQLRPVDLNAVIADLEKMLRRVIGEDIDLATSLHPAAGAVLADPGQIHQVVMNLVLNARDAMPGGGHLTIETAPVDLDERYARQHPGVTPGPYVMLAVSDTGVGMDAETQAHLFEPFFTTKPRGVGTGLGLSTVYGIVKQSNGSVWVYSEVGKGTTFKVYLPRVDAAPEPAAPPAPEGPAMRGFETVLVVEDEPEVRRLTCEILKAHGYRVLEAANAGEALLLSERHPAPIHLMITDVVMPGLNGRELAERLSPLRPGLRVLFMSGYMENTIAHRGLLDPDVAYLQKPFMPEQLLTKVRATLGPPQPPGTVLVLDAEESIRRLVRQILEPAGYAVLEAPTSREAVRWTEAGPVDLLIADLATPGGGDAVRALRARRPAAKVVLIAGGVEGPAGPAHSDATLFKPIRADALLKTIRELR